MNKYIICIHTEPASISFNYYNVTDEQEKLLCNGKIKRIGFSKVWLTFNSQEGKSIIDKQANLYNYSDTVSTIFDLLTSNNFKDPDAIANRISHGGPKNNKHKIINKDLIDELKNLISFAPESLPHQIETIKEIYKIKPTIPQVACFDTSFYIKMPYVSQYFPIPQELWHEGVRRYGFHSLTHEQVLDELPETKKGNTLIIRSSSNSSIVALKNGNLIDATAGFTPMGGLIMDTRSGDLDPGILLYLMREHSMSPNQVEHLLDAQSGLLGISKISSDLDTLIAQREENRSANLAVSMFIHTTKKFIGALATVLGGINNIVFAGPISEKSSLIRWDICQNLEFLGIIVDSFENNINSKIISTHKSKCKVYVLETNECAMAARHTKWLVFG